MAPSAGAEAPDLYGVPAVQFTTRRPHDIEYLGEFAVDPAAAVHK